jgi:uncharacterized protein (DUF952 family)
MTSLYIAVFLSVAIPTLTKEDIVQEQSPQYLYKVISVEIWEASQNTDSLKLSIDDNHFIHFSRDDQLQRITSKYWSKIPQYMVLKIDTDKLPGKMVFESNPGSSTKYYHLYEGSIPLVAVAESKIVQN